MICHRAGGRALDGKPAISRRLSVARRGRFQVADPQRSQHRIQATAPSSVPAARRLAAACARPARLDAARPVPAGGTAAAMHSRFAARPSAVSPSRTDSSLDRAIASKRRFSSAWKSRFIWGCPYIYRCCKLLKANILRDSISSYRELIVWQKSIELTVRVYALTRRFPAQEDYLTDASGRVLDSGERRGRASKAFDKGIHSVAWRCAGLSGGTGNFPDLVYKAGNDKAGKLRSVVERLRRDQQNAQRTDQITIHSPLTTKHYEHLTLQGVDVFNSIDTLRILLK